MAMEGESPNVIVLAGPNGAGKSTISQRLLLGTVRIRHFVNADTLARGLSGFHPEDMAIKAGKIMLEHLHDLAEQRANFAFETTLASRAFAPWIAELKKTGYLFHLFFVWVPSPEVSINRVKDRVRNGGHDVPEDTIRRRYRRGLENFFKLYQPIANTWQVWDNSDPKEPRIIAEKNVTMELVENEALWKQIREGFAK
jgi:predicted ABC-type ATPase